MMNRRHVLCIDDDETMQLIYQRVLATETLCVDSATSGEQGLQLARQQQPDLILLDLFMPDIDGLDVLRQLKAQTETAAIPTLMVTGCNQAISESACLNAGSADFIQKPVNANVLRARVRLQLKLIEQQAQLTALITDLERQKQTLQYMSCHDPLTGLYNRSMLEEVLKAELASVRRNQRKVALLMLDVDHFKAINYQHGHLLGDRVLASIAKIIDRRLRDTDRAFRYDGEEFLILLADTDSPQAQRIAAELLTLISESTVPVLHDHGVTVSIGVTLLVADDPNVERALVRADHALYASKAGGRNRVTFLETNTMQKTIIVADDDTLFRLMMRRHINALGFEVIEDENGVNVARQIKQFNPVACIIDIVMEKKEGIETIIEMKALPQCPKIIAVSSNNYFLSLATSFGVDGTLQKPVSPEALASKLREVGVLE